MQQTDIKNIRIKKIERSLNNLFLIKVHFLKENEEMDHFHSFYRIADSRRIVLLPRNEKEKELLEKAVAENKKWIRNNRS
ncbi:protein of unknown function [endosymbiont DhMRE of Dentiscutata heterogama]|uniref:hypothetical protein n=1 Tax=endosymbiont DhMRE of Dentiscutata heterogama TaxID=1609546 RepID=UPI000629DB50|nr:hypothetical protein [endosymbiont DhMRE of Dentiscutata heterogama]CFW93382.1 protein of unknown function [endosymbiont DhMRE of Dentiscutata heterogama]